MARRPRQDEAGSWHHVVNRAIGKRPYFETRSDKRYLLARVAREVRRGSLEVHAYCLMTTHFHLLVRSPVGELSQAMRRIQNAYSRYFHRRRRRDGPLIRARFFSKRVRSRAYRRAVVRYIDANAVKAGIVVDPVGHEFGSARAFILGRRPRWLSVDWVESETLVLAGEREFSGRAYRRAFASSNNGAEEAVIELVEARMRSASEVDPIDDLIGQTPEQVRRWMTSKAELADGHELGLPVCGIASVLRAIREHVESEGDWLVLTERNAWPASSVAQVGLLRDLSSTPLEQVGRLLDLRPWAGRRRIDLHRGELLSGGSYGARVGRIAQVALEMAT